MNNKLTIKNNSKSRRGFLQDAAKWIGATALLAATANVFTSNKIKAEPRSVNSSDPYVGEIQMVPYNFAPAGWMFCDGQLLSISENEVLFNLIGTTYGGDGQFTFALPDLRGRISIHPGNGFIQAEMGGSVDVTLTKNTIPSHSHSLAVNSNLGNSDNPTGNFIASNSEGINHYSNSAGSNANANSIENTGAGQSHNNMMPYLGVNHIISLFGVFPSQY